MSANTPHPEHVYGTPVVRETKEWNPPPAHSKDAVIFLGPCFRCGSTATQFFDGPGAHNRRMICHACEYADWRATAAAYNA